MSASCVRGRGRRTVHHNRHGNGEQSQLFGHEREERRKATSAEGREWRWGVETHCTHRHHGPKRVVHPDEQCKEYQHATHQLVSRGGLDQVYEEHTWHTCQYAHNRISVLEQESTHKKRVIVHTSGGGTHVSRFPSRRDTNVPSTQLRVFFLLFLRRLSISFVEETHQPRH